MIRVVKRIGVAAAGLALLSAPIVLAILMVRWMADLDSDTRTAAIGGLVALGVAVATYLGNQRTERHRAVEEHSRKIKIELYNEMIEFFIGRLLLDSKTSDAVDEDEMLRFFREITPKMITYASNGVIRSWGALRTSMLESAKVPALGTQIVWSLEGLFSEMRKDVGHSSLRLQKGDISRLYLNDVDAQLDTN